MTMTDRIAERKQRWTQLYSNESKAKNLFVIEPGSYYPERPLLWRSKKQERLDWIMKKYELQCKGMEYLEDDRVPFLDMLTGTEIFAECFGCKVIYPENNTPFASYAISNAKEAALLKKPKLEDTPLMFLFEMADELRKRAGNEPIFRLPDIQSPMDVAALIWDKNDFYIALIEEPEAVKYIAGMARSLITEFLDEWFSRYGHEFIGDFPDYYMPEGLCLSVDEVGIINEKMFVEYFTPELNFMSAHFGALGIHCCANSRHQWANFRNVPNLKLLNLVQPVGIIKEAYHFFGNHCVQMHIPGGENEAFTWPEQLPEGTRSVFQIYTDTIDDAKRIAEKMNRNCCRPI